MGLQLHLVNPIAAMTKYVCEVLPCMQKNSMLYLREAENDLNLVTPPQAPIVGKKAENAIIWGLASDYLQLPRDAEVLLYERVLLKRSEAFA